MDWRFRLKRLFAFHPLYLLGLLLGAGTHTRWLYRSIFYTLILKDVIYLVRGRLPLWEVDEESEQQTGSEL